MPDTPNDVFVGSSSEFLRLKWNPAKIIRRELEGRQLPDGTRLAVNIWPDWFDQHPNLETLQILDLAAKTSEWAILVFRADDERRKLEKDSIAMDTVRDNVLFELGLFYGHLGNQRVFILEQVEPSKKSLQIAGDIGGVHRLRFSDEASFVAALRKVLGTIENRSSTFFARWVPASSLAIGYCVPLRSFVDRRRGVAGGFRVEVLVPLSSFAKLEFSEVSRAFEESGYQQVGPDGTSGGRPAMWVSKALARNGVGEVYFDLPTTLFAAQRVIEKYLSAATKDEKERLVRSQARAFERQIQEEDIDYVRVKCLGNWERIKRYLKASASGDPKPQRR